jgi:hypothetical protein
VRGLAVVANRNEPAAPADQPEPTLPNPTPIEETTIDPDRFLGVPMRIDHVETTDKAPFAVQARAVGDSNIQYGAVWGVTPDVLDGFSLVTNQNPVVGQLCFIVPADEVDSMTVHTASTFTDVFFET